MHFHDDDDEGCEEKGKYCFIVALRITNPFYDFGFENFKIILILNYRNTIYLTAYRVWILKYSGKL